MAKRILLIEDDLDTAALEKQILAKAGYLAQSASNAKEVFDLLEKKFNPDLILLDIILPGMTGNELLSRLRKQGIKCPVIAVTAVSKITGVEEDLKKIDPKMASLKSHSLQNVC
ncbi:response regulator [archaeon]|nr:response regulator [archaeon]